MLARLFAFAIWAVVAASVMFWGLRLLTSAPQAPAYTVSALDGVGLRGDLSRVFGAPPVAVAAAAAAPPAQASRFKLIGVAAPRDAGEAGGLALISVDGKPARAINVGRSVEEGWVLQSVNRRGARLATNLGASTLDLEIPPLALATRGSLPAVPSSIVNASTSSAPGSVPLPPPTTPAVAPFPAPVTVPPFIQGLPTQPVPPTGLPSAGALPGPLGDGRFVNNPVANQLPSAPAIALPAEEPPRPASRVRGPRVNGAEPSSSAASAVQ